MFQFSIYFTIFTLNIRLFHRVYFTFKSPAEERSGSVVECLTWVEGSLVRDSPGYIHVSLSELVDLGVKHQAQCLPRC